LNTPRLALADAPRALGAEFFDQEIDPVAVSHDRLGVEEREIEQLGKRGGTLVRIP